MFSNINYYLIAMRMTNSLNKTILNNTWPTRIYCLCLRKGNSIEAFTTKATSVCNVLYLPKGHNICGPYALSFLTFTLCTLQKINPLSVLYMINICANTTMIIIIDSNINIRRIYDYSNKYYCVNLKVKIAFINCCFYNLHTLGLQLPFIVICYSFTDTLICRNMVINLGKLYKVRVYLQIHSCNIFTIGVRPWQLTKKDCCIHPLSLYSLYKNLYNIRYQKL